MTRVLLTEQRYPCSFFDACKIIFCLSREHPNGCGGGGGRGGGGDGMRDGFLCFIKRSDCVFVLILEAERGLVRKRRAFGSFEPPCNRK